MFDGAVSVLGIDCQLAVADAEIVEAQLTTVKATRPGVKPVHEGHPGAFAISTGQKLHARLTLVVTGHQCDGEPRVRRRLHTQQVARHTSEPANDSRQLPDISEFDIAAYV
ncbi:hypothetical protein [Nocardia brasiliensis]|uniref:hypothetical protein n=1 Tax=Nocardia brasiliensis TaxID=37326 RepID=UPI003D8EFA50